MDRVRQSLAARESPDSRWSSRPRAADLRGRRKATTSRSGSPARPPMSAARFFAEAHVLRPVPGVCGGRRWRTAQPFSKWSRSLAAAAASSQSCGSRHDLVRRCARASMGAPTTLRAGLCPQRGRLVAARRACDRSTISGRRPGLVGELAVPSSAPARTVFWMPAIAAGRSGGPSKPRPASPSASPAS